MPIIVNAKTTPTWRSNPNAVLVDRSTKWGNRFIIGKDGTREDVLRLYKEWIVGQKRLLRSLDELEGKDLVCWCYPKPCHALILLTLANKDATFHRGLGTLWKT